jgi:hypothetical protein
MNLIDAISAYNGSIKQKAALKYLETTIRNPKYKDLEWHFARLYRNNSDGRTINFVNMARFYASLPHQNVALKYLQDHLESEDLEGFYKLWNEKTPPNSRIELPVKWIPQVDARSCFSASVFMIAHYSSERFRRAYPNPYDYLPYLNSLPGDTTNPQSHLKALNKLGLFPVFRTDLNLEIVISLLEADVPVAFGFLHRGTDQNPIGGHWAVFYGVLEDRNTFLVHDPWGSIHNNYKGSQSEGQGVKMSRSLLNRRWTVEHPDQDSRDGWGFYLPAGSP